jgi:2,5-diketo-D-gluconate reductase B
MPYLLCAVFVQHAHGCLLNSCANLFELSHTMAANSHRIKGMTMEYISIEGTKIPALGYGTWKLTGSKCLRGVRSALDVGYRHIDTAQIYENEAEVGRAIFDSGLKREEIFLTTKIWTENLEKKAMRRSVEESLRKLRTDYVDLLLIHWPRDQEVPFEEQLNTLTSLQREGTTKFIGVSNFTLPQLEYAVEECHAKIINNQIEYHPYLSQKKILNYLRSNGMFLTAYCPLARGKVITDKKILEIAHKYDKSPNQIALRWLIQQGQVAAIPKAAQEANMRSNFEIFDFKLDDAEMNSLYEMAQKDGRLISPDFAPKWDEV